MTHKYTKMHPRKKHWGIKTKKMSTSERFWLQRSIRFKFSPVRSWLNEIPDAHIWLHNEMMRPNVIWLIPSIIDVFIFMGFKKFSLFLATFQIGSTPNGYGPWIKLTWRIYMNLDFFWILWIRLTKLESKEFSGGQVRSMVWELLKPCSSIWASNDCLKEKPFKMVLRW